MTMRRLIGVMAINVTGFGAGAADATFAQDTPGRGVVDASTMQAENKPGRRHVAAAELSAAVETSGVSGAAATVVKVSMCCSSLRTVAGVQGLQDSSGR
jgi:hypothetical protein